MAKSNSGDKKSVDKVAALPASAPPARQIISPEHAAPLAPPPMHSAPAIFPKRKVYLPPRAVPRAPVVQGAKPPADSNPAARERLAPAEIPSSPTPKRTADISNSVLPPPPSAVVSSAARPAVTAKRPKLAKTKINSRRKFAPSKSPADTPPEVGKPAAREPVRAIPPPASLPAPAEAKAPSMPSVATNGAAAFPPATARLGPEAVSPVSLARIARASASAAKAMGKSSPKLASAPPPAPVAEPNPEAERIVFIASECTPLAQTGGLGDVVAGLSKALRKRGRDARIIMPLYRSIDRQKHGIQFSRACCVHFGLGEEVWVGVYEGKLDGEVPIWFIDYDRYFGRPYLYDGGEDCYRFGVLSKAALQVCKDVGWIPHVAHVHDWMTSMSAVFLKTWDRVLSPLSETASVLTIHNIGYQGKFGTSVLSFYGLGGEYLRPDRFEDFGEINLLKAGVQYADVITTVSPTYAREIRGPIGGMGMAAYLNNRSENVFGIVNGVDTELWNPATDKYLPARYSADDLTGKAVCKKALQERFGLAVDPKIPLFGIVSRFAPQKGFDLIHGALPQALRDMIMQVVVLGTGDPFTENFFRWLHGAFPRSANAHIGFVPELAHLIEAGSDFFIMPSIYEPCGLNQMYSSLYGTLPVVRATGGLDDTVQNYTEADGGGTGFKFSAIDERALYHTIGWAVSTWYDRPQHYAQMQRRGMLQNFSWDESARQYEDVYARAMSQRKLVV